MNEDVKRWHNDVLSAFNAGLYDELIYEHHISSDAMKELVLEPLESDTEKEPLFHRGYFAKKNRMKYLIGPENYTQLPIKVKSYDNWKDKNDIVLVPTDCTGFRIIPEHKIPFKELVDGFVPFSHTDHDQFTVLKITAIMADIGRTYICIASEPEFCKSSVFQCLHAINNRTPVFEPRTVPGILNKITGTGNMVFDDIQNVPSEPKKAMEQMNMQIAGGASQYLNGAMKSHNTKNKYDVHLQSITYLYNDIKNYSQPDKKYFDRMFENNGAIDTRYLKLLFTGKLTQDFNRDFDITKTSEANRDYYIKFAKELLWLQEHKRANEYKRRWSHTGVVELKNRKRLTYDDICWGIDMYAGSQSEYDKLVNMLDNAILGYKSMLVDAGIDTSTRLEIKEEEV